MFGKKRSACRGIVEKLKDGGHLKNICTDGKIDLESFWKIQDGKA